MKKRLFLVVMAAMLIFSNNCVFASSMTDSWEYQVGNQGLLNLVGELKNSNNYYFDSYSSSFMKDIKCDVNSSDGILTFSRGDNAAADGSDSQYIAFNYNQASGNVYSKYKFSVDFKVDEPSKIESNKVIAKFTGRWLACKSQGSNPEDYGNAFLVELNTGNGSSGNSGKKYYTISLSGHEINSSGLATGRSQFGRWAYYGNWYRLTVDVDIQAGTITRSIVQTEGTNETDVGTYVTKDKYDGADGVAALGPWVNNFDAGVKGMINKVTLSQVSNYCDFSIKNINMKHDRFIVGEKNITKTDNGYTASVNIGNDLTDAAVTPTVIVAMYDADDKLLKVSSSNINLEGKTGNEPKYDLVKASVDFDESVKEADVKTVKAFLWRSINGDITPYSESWHN